MRHHRSPWTPPRRHTVDGEKQRSYRDSPGVFLLHSPDAERMMVATPHKRTETAQEVTGPCG